MKLNGPKMKKEPVIDFMIKMPEYIGEVYPFRYAEIHNYKGNLKIDEVVRTMVHYTFEDDASFLNQMMRS